jgi:AAA+ superfamily predicted ATPase
MPDTMNTNQWAARGEGRFAPCPPTIQTLAPGYYAFRRTMMGSWLEARTLNTDKLLILDDAPTKGIIHNIRRFWKSKESFRLMGMLHKRGALVYGPPGAGKSAMIELVCQDVIADGGIVLATSSPSGVQDGISSVRAVEPNRSIVQLLEDIDNIIEYKEEDLLSILDGENQVENIVYLATTNNIEKIPGRIRNRPSRFDETVLVGMPSFPARRAYLASKLGTLAPPETLDKWAHDTEGFAIAHLREMIVGVVCLQNDYESVLTRLRAMNAQDLALAVTAEGKDDE